MSYSGEKSSQSPILRSSHLSKFFHLKRQEMTVIDIIGRLGDNLGGGGIRKKITVWVLKNLFENNGPPLPVLVAPVWTH